eukprot:gene2827-1812_t
MLICAGSLCIVGFQFDEFMSLVSKWLGLLVGRLLRFVDLGSFVLQVVVVQVYVWVFSVVTCVLTFELVVCFLWECRFGFYICFTFRAVYGIMVSSSSVICCILLMMFAHNYLGWIWFRVRMFAGVQMSSAGGLCCYTVEQFLYGSPVISG